MNISAALKAVPIQEASSTPRCNAPRKSDRPTLIRRPVHVAIIAPNNTPKTPRRGRVEITGAVAVPAAEAGGVGDVLKAETPPVLHFCQTHKPSLRPKSPAVTGPAVGAQERGRSLQEFAEQPW
jgi:hypothetical protein